MATRMDHLFKNYHDGNRLTDAELLELCKHIEELAQLARRAPSIVGEGFRYFINREHTCIVDMCDRRRLLKEEKASS